MLENLNIHYVYPHNQVIGKDGAYVFSSHAAGMESGLILNEAIEAALTD